MSENIFTTKGSNEESWMSISDLMAGLMIVFVFIAIAYIKGVGQEQRRLVSSICDDLRQSLAYAIKEKKISVCESGITIRFNDPDTLFKSGKARLEPEFQGILEKLFPLYLSVLNKYKEEIEEVRIEGHTDEARVVGYKVIGYKKNNMDIDLVNYLGNMALSQDRTRNVLTYLFELDEVGEYKGWLREYMTANGLSFSRTIPATNEAGNVIVDDKGRAVVNNEASRRVEFKVILKTPKRLREIGEEFNE